MKNNIHLNKNHYPKISRILRDAGIFCSGIIGGYLLFNNHVNAHMWGTISQVALVIALLSSFGQAYFNSKSK